MSTVATSIKLPVSVKRRVEVAAKRAGMSPHAFIARAIEAELDADERYRRFVADALAAEREMIAAGPQIPLAEARRRLLSRSKSATAAKRRSKTGA